MKKIFNLIVTIFLLLMATTVFAGKSDPKSTVLTLPGQNTNCVNEIADAATAFEKAVWDVDGLTDIAIVAKNVTLNGKAGLTKVEVTFIDGGHDEGSAYVYIAKQNGTSESTCFVFGVTRGSSFTP